MTTTPIPERLAKLDELTLDRGAHDPPNGEMHACVMEAAAWIAGEEWSDSPECVSPVIAAFCRRWNDDLGDARRQMLKPYAAKVIGTRDDRDEERAWMVTDWLVRVHTPAWLDLAGIEDSAAALRALPPLTAETVAAAQPKVEKAKKEAAAARDAAWAAARDAARAAARAAAWDAARAAAWAAAGAAAWAAAGAAAGAAAWDAAGAAAGAAAWAAAGDAAWDAAWDAARDALKPTTQSLQASALELLDRMIALANERSAA